VEFEGKFFMAPKDWDGFLRYSFGDDYMIPPPASMQKVSSPLSYYDLG
jgi:phosphorylcholine metabolism protein LicD